MTKAIDIGALYGKYGPAIYARCKRLLKDAAAAEDATQDVFVKVMKAMDSAPSEEAVLPWIHRITTNHCLNLIRDGRRHAEPVEEVPEQADDEFEDSVVTRDFAHRVLSSTPEELKAPAMMYHGRGIEQAKVAQALGVSRRTVLYRLAEFTRRAMKLNDLADAGRA
ncbi:MAG: sigma-70 family RNA polymerase sigma factor [Myxococcales bacterium]|nr:sigma-70 family RNA polymerase sigma factor [Myxococcales bacterium]